MNRYWKQCIKKLHACNFIQSTHKHAVIEGNCTIHSSSALRSSCSQQLIFGNAHFSILMVKNHCFRIIRITVRVSAIGVASILGFPPFTVAVFIYNCLKLTHHCFLLGSEAGGSRDELLQISRVRMQEKQRRLYAEMLNRKTRFHRVEARNKRDTRYKDI